LRVEADSMRAYQSEVVVQDGEKRTVAVALEPLARGPAPEEPTGPLHGFELGLRTGYGVAIRGEGKSVSFVPIWLDIGYRLGAPTYLGIYLQHGWVDRSDTCGIRRHGPNPDSPLDAAIRYGYSECRLLKAGVALIFHLLPRTIVDPYFGFDIGAQFSMAEFKSYDPVLGTYGLGHDDNGSIQPGMQLGLDVHPAGGLAIGVFGQSGPDFGGEGKPSDEDNSEPRLPCQPNEPCNDESGGGVTGHVVGGVRVGYTFP
jgi:hypothetical protein